MFVAGSGTPLGQALLGKLEQIGCIIVSNADNPDPDFNDPVAVDNFFAAHVPDYVFMVAGDHATPAIMAGHSWHPVPFLLHSKWTLGEGVECFSERSLGTGALGRFQAEHIMLQALAHAEKFTKFGP